MQDNIVIVKTLNYITKAILLTIITSKAVEPTKTILTTIITTRKIKKSSNYNNIKRCQ